MMVYENRFNVYMNAYGDDGGGGSNPNGPSFGSNPSVGGDVDFTVQASQYKFTDPPRYYKANDPYYYEIDNIPLKQLHENCLWLRDQMSGGALEVSGVSTRQVSDLKPSVNDEDRLVRVSPGKFIGRVNSVSIIGEGGDNIGTISLPNYTVDVGRETVYIPHQTEIQDTAWRAIVGASIDDYVGGVGANGLFGHYQHHQSFLETDSGDAYAYRWSAGGDSWVNNGPISIDNLSKIQTAVWRQVSGPSAASFYGSDLRLLATDFCRKWGGVFRTSVVSVEETLAIIVPDWSDEDFIDNHTVYDPQVRIDLVFVYTKPVDSTSSDLVTEKEGDSLRTISSPALGIVKGAGGILSAKNDALDIVSNPSIIGNESWVNQSNAADKWYDTSGGTNAGVAINSPLSNQTATTTYPIAGAPTYSFPSPDDLMNMAPLIADTYLGSNLAGVGQSVLPLCYVIVKKNQAFITDADIIDIRPFLRTTELTYNERSGVAGANPPLSLANPAVGKAELYTAVQEVRNHVVEHYGLVEGGTNGGGGGTTAINPSISFSFRNDYIGLGTWGSDEYEGQVLDTFPDGTGRTCQTHFPLAGIEVYGNDLPTDHPYYTTQEGKIWDWEGGQATDVWTPSISMIPGLYKIEVTASVHDSTVSPVEQGIGYNIDDGGFTAILSVANWTGNVIPNSYAEGGSMGNPQWTTLSWPRYHIYGGMLPDVWPRSKLYPQPLTASHIANRPAQVDQGYLYEVRVSNWIQRYIEPGIDQNGAGGHSDWGWLGLNATGLPSTAKIWGNVVITRLGPPE